MSTLVVAFEGRTVSFDIPPGESLIGRHPDCAIEISDPSVSGRHATICRENGSVTLQDAGSRNGTFVNERPVREPVKLQHNDAIQFGNARARYNDPDSAPASPLDGPTAAEGGLTSSGLMGQLEDEVRIDDDSAGTSITGQLVGVDSRFGVLEANPEKKLKAVLEISRSLAGTVNLSALLPKILESLFQVFRYADRGCILLKDEETGELIPRAMHHRRQGEDRTVRLSRTVIEKVVQEKAGILSADAAADDAFANSESIAELKIRSMMCVPLLGLADEVIGVLSIDSLNPMGQFTQDDLEILVAVAGQAALTFETARLVQVYAAKQKQDGELEIARGVQQSLLPSELIQVDGYEFYASYDAAQAVGGDYYDQFQLTDGRICLSFGDVAGKGVPGALVMSRISSCVQSTIQHVDDVLEAMQAINKHMCDKSSEGRFVTYILCVVDTRNHRVTLSNAGHMSPIIRRADGSIDQFDEEKAGLPIGIMDDYPYEVESRDLEPGDLVMITTDGVDEAMNPQGELYGANRLVEFVRNGPAKARELGEALLADVRKHANGRPQNDDITIMCFSRDPAN